MASMPATPGGGKKAAAADAKAAEDGKFLYLVLTSGGTPTIDWSAISTELAMNNGAVSKRWSRLKTKVSEGKPVSADDKDLLMLCIKHSEDTGKGRDWKAIAAACNKTVGAAQKQMSRIRIKLRETSEAGGSVPSPPLKGKPKDANPNTPNTGTKRKPSATPDEEDEDKTPKPTPKRVKKVPIKTPVKKPRTPSPAAAEDSDNDITPKPVKNTPVAKPSTAATPKKFKAIPKPIIPAKTPQATATPSPAPTIKPEPTPPRASPAPAVKTEDTSSAQSFISAPDRARSPSRAVDTDIELVDGAEVPMTQESDYNATYQGEEELENIHLRVEEWLGEYQEGEEAV